MNKKEIYEIIAKMTLEEKASLTSGYKDFETQPIKHLSIPSLVMADGPHGLRKPETNDKKSLGKSLVATCFPTASALGSSWDIDLLKKTGVALAKQAKAQGANVLLGPGANIKRSPLCGRNFEYLSEDPLLSSSLATHYIVGVQEEGVGTSLKHYLANNQEFHRHTSSSEIDERTLREIYLASFEKAVKEGKPKTIMCSYNLIGGTYASENKYFLTDILRDEWQYEGMVVSDWGAVHNRVEALKAGTDLTMPDEKENDHLIVDAVKNNNLSEEELDLAIYRILKTIDETKITKDEDINFEQDHLIAKEIAIETAVLLKNENQILPLNNKQKILYVGEFAESPRYQGHGSSEVNSYKALKMIDLIQGNSHIDYVKGFSVKKDHIDEDLENEVLSIAANYDVIVIFAGLPNSYESEGFDRDHMDLPINQNHLIEKLAELNLQLVVILHNGSPVTLPWADKVKAILGMNLAGEAVTEATHDLIFGLANPSGRLAESYPLRVEDNPSYLDYLGTHEKVYYREGVYVGYRYYTSKKMDVRFPFGHGLSYSKFTYANLKVSQHSMDYKDQLTVTVDVTNHGPYAGREVVQLYVQADTPSIRRPLRELRAFTKIALEPKETQTVSFVLEQHSFSYWHEHAHKFHVESGVYTIQIAKSSQDIVLSQDVDITGEYIRVGKFSELSVIADVAKNPKGKAFLDQVIPDVLNVLKQMNFLGEDVDLDDEKIKRQSKSKGLYSQTLNVLKRFLPHITKEEWDYLYRSLNEE